LGTDRIRGLPSAGAIDWRRVLATVLLGVLWGYLLFRVVALVTTGHVSALWLKDYDLYMDATRSWLAGGPFYPEWQTSGAYELRWGAILYPPISLVLFVPFSLLPPLLWVLIPLVVTLAIIGWHRPGPWRLIAIAALLCIYPLELLAYTAGTPTIWIVMFMALATRWPWWSALILIKPTLLPFGMLGIRTRGWWLAFLAITVVTLAMWSLTLTWSLVMIDQQGADLLYSMVNVPFMLVPLVAAYPTLVGRRQRPATYRSARRGQLRRADGPGAIVVDGLGGADHQFDAEAVVDQVVTGPT
jgi:hypothetical protein